MGEIMRVGLSNRHPVDELGEVRESIRRLEFREAELRRMIIDKECSRIGDDFTASVKTQKYERLDTAAILREFGRERMQRFLRLTEATLVKVARK